MNNNVERLLPSINSIKQHSDNIILNITINAELRCFKGHFDDVAVAPGIVQLEWAITFAQKYLGMQGNVQDVSVLKFQKLLLPEMKVQLEIIKNSPKKFTFSYSDAENKYASARVELA